MNSCESRGRLLREADSPETEPRPDTGPQLSLTPGNDDMEPILRDSKSMASWFRGYSGTFKIAVPLCIYVGSSFLFFPVFQDLIYAKSCIAEYGRNSGYCSNSSAIHKDPTLLAEANHILLFSSLALSLPSLIVSVLLGSLSDRWSRKVAALIPFVGLTLSDLTFLLQTVYMTIPPYWLIGSQFVFGLGGGYTAIFGTLFAFAAAEKPPEETAPEEKKRHRSTKMALLEGSMGLGGTVGYLSTGPLLEAIGYTGVNLASLIIHTLCFFYIAIALKDDKSGRESEGESRPSSKLCDYFIQAGSTAFKRREGKRRSNILILLAAFGISYFVFSGSVDILFYYLKQQLNFSTSYYGYLKGGIYGMGTIMILFLYPTLKAWGVHDSSLALVGLTFRLLGRTILATVFSNWFTFLLIGCDMFSRWGAASLRSLLSLQVEEGEQGRMFATIALLEGVCSLIASLVFNALYPASLTFFPSLSYVIMAVLMVFPIALILSVRKRLNIESNLS